MTKQTTVESVVFVIDDDAAVRASLKSLFKSVGLYVELFGSADEFLKSQRPDVASCLVLDVRLPGISGLEFQSELAKERLFRNAHRTREGGYRVGGCRSPQ